MKFIKTFWFIVVCSFSMSLLTADLSAAKLFNKTESSSKKEKVKARYSFKKGAKNQKILDQLGKRR